MEGTESAQPAVTEAAQPTNETAAQAPSEQSQEIKDAAQEAIRKFKVKVMGEELEVDEDELKRGYSHQKAANKAMQEGLKAKRQAEQFIQMMKDEGKLFDVLKQLGHDPRSLSEKYLSQVLEEEMLDPREKELREVKRKLTEKEEFEKQVLEAQKKEQLNKLKQKYAEDYNKTFVQAIETEKLPATKETIQNMAKYIYRATQLGYKMEATEAARLVKEDMANYSKAIASSADPETLVNLFGPEIADKIRKWDLARVKTPEQKMTTTVNEPKKREREGKRMSPQEWRAFNRR